MPREVIAHGVASVHVPEYITIGTGKFSTDPEKVMITVKRGNTVDPPILEPWFKMHGVKFDYFKHGQYIKASFHDDGQVTFMATGAWHVDVEKPLK